MKFIAVFDTVLDEVVLLNTSYIKTFEIDEVQVRDEEKEKDETEYIITVVTNDDDDEDRYELDEFFNSHKEARNYLLKLRNALNGRE